MAETKQHCWPDLRDYILSLEKDDLFRWVNREVDKDWEIGSIVRLLFRGIAEEKRFAVGFHRIRGHTDNSVAVGLIGASKRSLAKILGVEPEIAAIHSRWSEALAQPLPPRMISTGPSVINRNKRDGGYFCVFKKATTAKGISESCGSTARRGGGEPAASAWARASAAP